MISRTHCSWSFKKSYVVQLRLTFAIESSFVILKFHYRLSSCLYVTELCSYCVSSDGGRGVSGHLAMLYFHFTHRSFLTVGSVGMHRAYAW